MDEGRSVVPGEAQRAKTGWRTPQVSLGIRSVPQLGDVLVGVKLAAGA